MLMLGIAALIIAVILIALGIINTAVHVLLWVGIGLIVVAVVLVILSRRGPRTRV
jgi:hypothetical protein